MSTYGHSALNICRAYSTDTCDIRNFVCRGEKWYFSGFFFPINVENCALSSMCWIIKELSSSAKYIRQYSAPFRRVIVKCNVVFFGILNNHCRAKCYKAEAECLITWMSQRPHFIKKCVFESLQSFFANSVKSRKWWRWKFCFFSFRNRAQHLGYGENNSSVSNSVLLTALNSILKEMYMWSAGCRMHKNPHFKYTFISFTGTNESDKIGHFRNIKYSAW